MSAVRRSVSTRARIATGAKSWVGLWVSRHILTAGAMIWLFANRPPGLVYHPPTTSVVGSGRGAHADATVRFAPVPDIQPTYQTSPPSRDFRDRSQTIPVRANAIRPLPRARPCADPFPPVL